MLRPLGQSFEAGTSVALPIATVRTREQIEIIEAAYTLDVPHVQWQYRLTDLVAARWRGTAASFIYDATTPSAPRCERVMIKREGERMVADALVSIPLQDPAFGEALFLTRPHLAELVELLGPGFESSSDYQKLLEAIPDLDSDCFSIALRTLDPSRQGLFFALPPRPLTARTRSIWGQIAVHLGLAWRLRRALIQSSTAVDGRGEPDATVAREALRQAAHNVMRARSSLAAGAPDQAQRIWQGLASGTWSLVDRFETDGTHYLVAHRNPTDTRDPRVLTEREGQVARYLALGYANKLIGYCLGLSASAVADHVASIERKIGITSRIELVRLLGALDKPAAEEE